MRKRVKKPTKNEKPSPGMIKILSAVAEAGEMTMHELVSAGRKAGVTMARAAVYKLATAYGHPKDDIAYFLDRNRRVAYNYEANLEGHLKSNKEFKTLIQKAKAILEKHPHRDYWHPTQLPKEPEPEKKPATGKLPGEPEFHDTKLQLGWFFTAEDNRRMWYACRAAEKFFETYGKAPTAGPVKSAPTKRKVPKELPTAEAIEYLCASNKTLMRGVELGHLHRFKKPGMTTYWYHTDELDAFRSYIAKNKLT